ncbi:hypothetical protein [Pelagibacterium mangrovi]|uniref:hypothetical protein n=1 Tax=Pelagibacterium mangrovi TaxID=3119828 RepID=UPI002FCC5C5C
MKNMGKGKSVRRQVAGRRNIQNFNIVMRDTYPRCGAKAKSTGQPCQRFAMANGRCDVHGGRTPKGKDWHKPRWPNKSAPDANEKLNRKLKDLDRAYRKRERRLVAMTDDERARHEEWQRSHKPGSAAARQAAKARRQKNADARARYERSRNEPQPLSPELEHLEQQIAQLEMEKLILERGSVFD